MEFNYEATPTFARIHRDPNQFKFVMGPVGSGKSSGCILDITWNAMNQKPGKDGVRRSRYAIIRATYPALEATVIKSWINWFKDKIKIVFKTPIVGTVKFDLPDGTSMEMELFFMAVNDERAIEKLRSLELTGAHFNEASELTPELLEMVKSRIDRYPDLKDGGATKPMIICDYNGVSTDHWLYKMAEEIKPEGHSFYKQPPAVLRLGEKANTSDPNVVVDSSGNAYRVNMAADNIFPPEWDEERQEFVHVKGVTPNYYLNQVRGGDADFINVNIMNNYGEVRSGRPVYKEYDDNMHYSEDEELYPMSGVPIIVGIDQGLTPAAIFTQQAPDGTIMVLDEITTEDCSLHEFCHELLWPLINSKYRGADITLVVDPATVQRSMNDAKAGTEIFKEAGFKYRTAKSNSFVERKEAVVYFLRMNSKFKISPHCKVIRRGFISEYKYDEIRVSQSKQFKDRPAKNEYSHPHDALQYACLEYYHKPKGRRASSFTRRSNYRPASVKGGY